MLYNLRAYIGGCVCGGKNFHSLIHTSKYLQYVSVSRQSFPTQFLCCGFHLFIPQFPLKIANHDPFESPSTSVTFVKRMECPHIPILLYHDVNKAFKGRPLHTQHNVYGGGKYGARFTQISSRDTFVLELFHSSHLSDTFQ